MAYFFTAVASNQKTSIRAPDIAAAREWYITEARKFGLSPSGLMRDKEHIVEQLDINSIGRMFMFFYDPLHRDTLPFYDSFPLVFPIGFKDNGFLGLNMHYLPPFLRAQLMSALYTTQNNTDYNETTMLRLSYSILNTSAQFRYFRPCLKHYLWDHVAGSGYLNVEVKNWDAALLLPVERFKKASSADAWRDSTTRF